MYMYSRQLFVGFGPQHCVSLSTVLCCLNQSMTLCCLNITSTIPHYRFHLSQCCVCVSASVPVLCGCLHQSQCCVGVCISHSAVWVSASVTVLCVCLHQSQCCVVVWLSPSVTVLCGCRYTPQSIELDHKLKPFIPDFIPSVGDIDAFIKVTALAALVVEGLIHSSRFEYFVISSEKLKHG